MSKNVKLTVYADHTRNKISKNIFGHFMEHSADVIYGSVYDPESRFADADGFRKDVLEVLKEVQVPMLRYPGGIIIGKMESDQRKKDQKYLTMHGWRKMTIAWVL